MIALDFIVFTVGTYFLGFYVGHKLTKKKYERRLSTPRQTVQSGSSINGEARSETK